MWSACVLCTWRCGKPVKYNINTPIVTSLITLCFAAEVNVFNKEKGNKNKMDSENPQLCNQNAFSYKPFQ